MKQTSSLEKETISRKELVKWELVFLIINTILIMLLAQRYTFSINLPTSFNSWFYYINLTFGHFSVLTLFLFAFILLPLSLILPNKKIIFTINIILSSFLVTLLAIDTFVFDQYRFHISPFFLQMMLDAGDQIIGFSSSMWITLIAFILLVVLIETYTALLSWKYRDLLHGIFRPKIFFSLTFIMFMTSQLIHIFADAHYERSITRLSQNYPIIKPATAQSFLIKQGWATAQPENNKLKIKASNGINYPATEIKAATNLSQQPLNILMIVLDSWRYDMMDENITPNIHQFTQQSIKFENHYSGANSTRSGIFSMFYSLPGSYWETFESNQISPVILDTLEQQNYQYKILASAPLNNPEFDRTVFKNIPDLQVKTPGKNALDRDKNIVNSWLTWTEKQSKNNNTKPFFGFVFLDAIHGYTLPDDIERPFKPTLDTINYFKLSNNTDREPIINLYKNLTYFNDKLVGKIIDDLKARKLDDNTVVIITGDHGQEVNDNGLNYWGHNSNFTRYQTQVPFVMYWPKKQADVIEKRTSHYDIVPTIMKHALNIESPTSDYSTGRDLLSDSLDDLNSLVMTSYSMISVQDFNQDVMMLKNKDGSVDYLDSNYRPTERKPAAKTIQKAINDMTRFYR